MQLSLSWMLDSIRANIIRSDEEMTEIEKAKFECACKLLETVVTSEQKKKANARMTEQEIVDYVSALVNGTFSGITTP